ncbi:MAG: GH25 family lysozyme [Eggerthellaceae bacterium]|nr:GH25 family lysozyme [Eggerthellaceae bacterium]
MPSAALPIGRTILPALFAAVAIALACMVPQQASASSMQGIDVSHHNGGLDISVTDAQFAVIKATQGTKYRYSITSQFASQTTKSKKELGFYHYAEGRDPIAEADYFVQEVQHYLPHAVLVLDWEGQDNISFGAKGADDAAWVKAFRDEVKKKTGVDCLVYGSAKDSVFNLGVERRYLWVARYASDQITGWQSVPWLDSSYDDCAMRQYTSTGRVANYQNNLDLNKFYGSKLDWRALEVSTAGSTAAGSTFTGDPNAYMSGWIQDNGSWHYYVKGQPAKGWQTINGETYYFSSTTGAMQTGWLRANGSWYFFDASGALKTGWLLDGGTWYYLDGTGAMAIGWRNVNGAWYYFDASSGAMQTGWVSVDGQRYYLDGSGAMRTGWLLLDGSWYYLDGSGALATGWHAIDGTWYALDPATGEMATGWLQDNGTWYYLDSSGAMATGWRYVNGSWYWFWGSGAMQGPGWAWVDGSWYWFRDFGGMATGWAFDGNAWYYLNDSGSIYAGWLYDGSDWYFLSSGGAMATGWLQNGGAWYYLTNSGAMAVGAYAVDGSAYVFDPSGALCTGWAQVDGIWYYLDGSGGAHTGWLSIGPHTYYFDSAGKMAVGWVTLGDTAYYFDESGALEKTENVAVETAPTAAARGGETFDSAPPADSAAAAKVDSKTTMTR